MAMSWVRLACSPVSTVSKLVLSVIDYFTRCLGMGYYGYYGLNWLTPHVSVSSSDHLLYYAKGHFALCFCYSLEHLVRGCLQRVVQEELRMIRNC